MTESDEVIVHSHSFDKPGGKDGKSVVWLERAGPDPETNLAKKRFFEDFIGNGTVSRPHDVAHHAS